MIKNRFGRICIVVLSAASTILFASQAGAREVQSGSATVEGNVVDAWEIVGDSVNLLMGPRSCTISASPPANSANLVVGSGSVGCNKNYAKLTLTVCIQAKQAFVAEQTTWEDAGCSPTKAALNSKNLSGSASASCRPGPWLYRTRTTAEGFNADSSDPVFTGIIHSGSQLFDCFLSR